MQDPFSPEIVSAARDGDPKALNQLLEALRPILTAYFYQRLGNLSAQVEDLTQNTLLRLSRGIKRIEHPERFKAFALKAALFELQDFYRGRHSLREQVTAPEDLQQAFTYSPSEAEQNIDLEKILKKLPPKAQEILLLRAYGYRYAEIAKKLGTTEAAIKMQVRRAFQKLQEMFLTLFFLFIFTLLSGSK